MMKRKQTMKTNRIGCSYWHFLSWLLTPRQLRRKATRASGFANADWRFQKSDSSGTEGQLAYEKIRPWVIATGNEFLPQAPKPARPAGNLGDTIAYAQKGFDDRGWRQLNLPHDWGIEGPFKQEYPGETGKLPWWGVGWYRKHFRVSPSEQGSQFRLEIDGAMAYATVWLNGKFVGGWPYGYASFEVDLTPYVESGAGNVIAIRLDNPPDSSRWYPGGGIYRNVWLVKTGRFTSVTGGRTSRLLR
jgi:beta-galactosidase